MTARSNPSEPSLASGDERERLAQLFEQAPSLMALLREPSHRIVLANHAFQRLFGERQTVGRTAAEILPPALSLAALRRLDEAYQSGEPVRLEAVRLPTGLAEGDARDERILDLILQPVHDPNGAVIGIFVEGTDVTDRVLAERRLQSSFEIRTVGIIYWGPSFGLTQVNDAFLRMTGYSREEALGLTWQQLTPAEFWPASELAVHQVNTLGEAVPYEKQYFRKDGSRWWGLFAPRRVSDQEVVEFVLDVTERRDAEDALREAEERYRLAVEATDDVVWDWDLATDTIRRNEALERLFGYAEGDLVETLGWWKNRIHPDDVERVSTSLDRVTGGAEQTWSVHYRFARNDGTYADVLDRGTLPRDEAGQPRRMVGAMHDLTPHKQAEAALRQLNETLEHRVLEQVTARMKIEDALRQSQKLEAIGQLTGGVAHDFNNLLTIIRSAAEMLRRPGVAEEKRARYVDAIAETADRAAKLTSQLLAFSRRQALKPQVFNVGGRIEAVRDMLATVVGSRVALEIDTDCEICYVEADPSQFDTALVNMAVNARDAMKDVGQLRIGIEPASCVPSVRGHFASKGDFVAIRVADTGCGIEPDKLAQIFEPFFTTKEVGKGTGLGLSQVYGFTKQSGGEVSVHSVVGQGTTFTMFLPRVPAQLGQAASDQTEQEAQGRGHILVVEDNEQVGAFRPTFWKSWALPRPGRPMQTRRCGFLTTIPGPMPPSSRTWSCRA